jgi:hypothetical protein
MAIDEWNKAMVPVKGSTAASAPALAMARGEIAQERVTAQRGADNCDS